MRRDELPDPQVHLDRLKDFQLRTVEYVFRRLYEDAPPTRRFLVADEVGLGKTMVAKGVIAKAIRHLDRAGVQRIDVVYICSNAAIAAQNLARLNILPRDPKDKTAPQTSFATRLTLLPLHVGQLGNNRVNFISFTPGTTFSLKSREGVMRERAHLFSILRPLPGVSTRGLRRMLQGSRCGWKSWKNECALLTSDHGLVPDPDLVKKMRRAVRRDPALLARVQAATRDWKGMTERYARDAVQGEERLALTSDLRQRLSMICLEALQPNLIVLDEFQRFKKLLKEDSEEAGLAQSFFNHPGRSGEPPPRILLLSATPYKMYTVSGEVEDDHYKDLVQTLQFLHGQDGPRVEATQKALAAYRNLLTRTVRDLSADPERRARAESELRRARDHVQGLLLDVMVRTERTASSAHRDAMVRERVDPAPLASQDLLQAVAVDRVARAVGAQDIVEYWKSAPYLLSFMKGYDLKRRLDHHVVGHKGAAPGSDEMCDAVEAARPHMVDAAALDRYGDLDPANPRLRLLLQQMFSDELWRLLWLPPSMAYLEPAAAYAKAKQASKALVFSSWNVVPDAIAAVSSYLAERSMVTQGAPPSSYKSLTKDRRGLLRFSVSGNRYAGMGALLMQYPSPYLAGVGDPLRLARAEGAVVPAEQAVGTVAARIQADLDRLAVATDPGRSRRDPRWYWAAVGLLDAANHPRLMDWLEDQSDTGLSGVTRQASHREDASGFEKVVERFVTFVKSPEPLGAPPDDLAEVLARVALGAPGVCSLRALGRQVPDAVPTDPDVLRAAAAIGEGFRTLFNLPETMGLLGAFERHRSAGDDEEDDHYWRRCVDHGLEGNLQAVLDEQAHVLRESLGLSGYDRSVDEVVHGIAGDLSDALSVRTANVFAEELRRAEGPNSAGWIHRDHDALAFRTRFGLRLGELREDDKRTHRIDTVRKAFNSPFRPFLLASTSVGQEGLDFHTWCHVIYHWNLPGNPVDMEQREGRVHRYKGLAVRRNIARAFRAAVLRGDWDGVGDPWRWMFDRARDERDAELDDLVPYWLFTDVPDGAPTAVERRVPIVPLSREAQRYQALKRSLVLYRLAFGQPRQDDLVNWLQQQLGEEAAGLVEGWRIDLRAP